jgi:hypothetical protein
MFEETKLSFSLILIRIFLGSVSFTRIRLKDRDRIVKVRCSLTFHKVDVKKLSIVFFSSD